MLHHAEAPVPAEEQFVLLLRVPGELGLQPRDAHDRLVDGNEVRRLPRARQRLNRLADGRLSGRTRAFLGLGYVLILGI